MKYSLRFVVISMLLTFGLSEMAHAGDVEKRSLPVAGAAGFSCQLVNVSVNDIAFSMTIRPLPPYKGIGVSGSLAPDAVYSTAVQAGYAAYCKVQYVGRPSDIVATFCAYDEVGNCTVLVPVE